ncbi:Protein of unknown function [Cryobacterium flavum]|uniref:DUF4229 domain-containing protein n=1 Tax=Cryobacterium flavum TaxID=1424659 RepID=A0A4R8V8A7_9MICO|nr:MULTISPECIES: DUF4229 domain-containing protein [Cryobacterium]TFB77847.1 DUF4229 domain-containing protein [Cryobacterium flavum]TFD10153.1 DUF4229 domain-containing protein [Cryobacterium sp. TMT1-66-1]SDN47178.1 Protein of unknown function [Cryobacterium flavum]
MKSVAPWLYYSVLRVLMFAVPLAILLSLGFWPWASAVIAALIGLCLSYLLLGKSRESVARDLYKARHPDKEPVNPDSEIEDSALNAAEQQSNPVQANSERESKSQ